MADSTRRATVSAYVGERLRAVRLQRGLSVADVAARSAGRFRAGAVAGYEQGERTLPIVVLARMARFYCVSVAELLPVPVPRELQSPGNLIINLAALNNAPRAARSFLEFASSIRSTRQDFRSHVLSLRHADLRALAAIYETSPAGVVALMRSWNVVAEHQALLDIVPA